MSASFTPEAALGEMLLKLELELQVSVDQNGWHVRVRGTDPVGAIHENSWCYAVSPIIEAMYASAFKFCTLYGIPIPTGCP